METPKVDATNTENGRKRKSDALLDNTPPLKKQDTKRLDFLYRDRPFLEELPVEALSKAAAIVHGHKCALIDGFSIARARGQITSASALFERTLRSFREAPLVLCKHEFRRGEPTRIIDLANRHPNQFQLGKWKGAHGIVTVEHERWQIHREDYLALRSGRLRPDPHVHVLEDSRLEYEYLKRELEHAYSMTGTLQNVLRNLESITYHTKERMTRLSGSSGRFPNAVYQASEEDEREKKRTKQMKLGLELGGGKLRAVEIGAPCLKGEASLLMASERASEMARGHRR